jgi:glycosyltransferase involved in cell wall biosynthesis
MLTPGPPYPLDGGFKRVHTLCKLLRDRYRFSLLTFRRRLQTGGEAVEDFQRERLYLNDFDEVHWIDLPDQLVDSVGDLRLSPDARRYYSEEMRMALEKILADGRIDLVHAEFDMMAPYGLFVGETPCVLTQHDMGGISFLGSYYREMAGWRKALRAGEWLSRVSYAKRVNALFDRVVLVSEGDRAPASRVAASDKLRIVPTGVDVEHFTPDPGRGVGARIAFVGHYPHFPNEDAAVRLCREIYPRVLRRRPDATLSLIGSSPTPAVLEAAASEPGIAVTGTVPDVLPHLREASVFAAPVRLGRGIKGKILEAFAAGIPVVASSAAASGLDAAPGRDLIVADDPARFAAAIVDLMGNDALRREYASRGRRVAERYDWRLLAPRLGRVYEELLAAQ